MEKGSGKQGTGNKEGVGMEGERRGGNQRPKGKEKARGRGRWERMGKGSDGKDKCPLHTKFLVRPHPKISGSD